MKASFSRLDEDKIATKSGNGKIAHADVSKTGEMFQLCNLTAIGQSESVTILVLYEHQSDTF